MAQSNQRDEPTLPAPALRAPREAALVHGRRVVFAWDAVEGATRYQIEVARDASFEDLVLERVVEGPAATSTEGSFDPDGMTYYWRVLSGNEAGWSNGDHVESFVSGTEEDAKAHISRPDERLGPYPALIRSVSVEAAAEVTGGDELFEEEARMGVAHEGVEAGQILGIALAIAVAIVMMVLVLFQWTRIVELETRTSAARTARNPDLLQSEMESRRMLQEYGVVDPDAAVYRIPIERAMELMVQEAAQGADTVQAPAFPAQ